MTKLCQTLKKIKKKESEKMKIKELRLLNITIKQNDQILYQGKTEEIPPELKEKEYKKIYFQGVDVIVEI